jgi:heme/copper-type cytochrome/quinol oxidase subunit 2
MTQLKKLRGLLFLPAIALLSACNMVSMNPSGDIAVQQRNLIITSTLLMLLIIVPVIVLTVVFAWRYRKSAANAHADYRPDWNHSTQLELVIWAAPLLIVIALGALTWISTRPLPLPGAAGRRAKHSGRRQAARRRSGGTRLEVAVHLPRTRNCHGERDGRAG